MYLWQIQAKGSHLFVLSPTIHSACQTKKQALKSNEHSLKLCDQFVVRHTVYSTWAKPFLFLFLYSPRSTVDQSLWNGRSPPGRFLELDIQPYWVTRLEWPWSGSWLGTQWSLSYLCWDGRTCWKNNRLRNTPSIRFYSWVVRSTESILQKRSIYFLPDCN